MNKIKGSEEWIIPGILETVEDARKIIYENVRTGKEITPEHVINEIVYKVYNRIKDERNLPYYKNNIILLKTQDQKIVEKNTLDWFKDSIYSKKLDSFYDIKKGLMNVAFGKIPIPFFDYVQRILNETGKQRIGGEKLKDAHIAIHPTRMWWTLSDLGLGLYCKIYAMFHDCIEERRDWRYENLISQIKDGVIEYGPKEKELLKTENQEEFREISDLILTYDFGKDFYNGELLLNSLLYNIISITNNVKEEYGNYSERLINRIYSEEIKKITEGLTNDSKKQIELYSAPLDVKFVDLFDNTDTVREGDISDKIDRLSNNLIFIKKEDTFLSKHIELKSETLIKSRENVIKESKDEIKSVFKQYEGKQNPALEVRIEKFKEMEIEYNNLKNI